MYYCEPLHMDKQEKSNQLEPIDNCSVLIQDVVWKTCQEQWTIGMRDGIGSGKPVLVAHHNDNDVSTW